MKFNALQGLATDFSTSLVRQKVFTAVSKYVSGYLNRLSTKEIDELIDMDMVSLIETEILQNTRKKTIEDWIRVGRQHINCFSENDLATIWARIIEMLDPDRIETILQHEEWFKQELRQIWSNVLYILKGE